jgi:hypothetical protein
VKGKEKETNEEKENECGTAIKHHEANSGRQAAMVSCRLAVEVR